MRNLIRSLCLVLALMVGAQATTIHALNFTALNTTAGSDIRLIWDGTNLLPRAEHTAIWRYNPVQQTGYYAVAWHSQNTGSWDNGVYSAGTHPYPADGSLDAAGQATGGTGGSGTVHYWEIAGVQGDGGFARDFIASPGGSPLQVVVDHWYTQVRRVHLATSGTCNGSYEHVFIPDYDNNPSFSITQCVASIASGGSTPAFYFGASDWESGIPSAGRNDETPGGKIRGIQLYGVALSDADIATEVTNSTSNTPLTSAGQADVWYMNQDPIPTDITDKSTAGHTPTWANANRPAQWDSTYSASSGTTGRASLLGVGR